MASYITGHIICLGVNVDLILFYPSEMAADRIHLVLLPFQAVSENFIQSGQRQIRKQLLIIDRLPELQHLLRNGGRLIENLQGIHLHVPKLIGHIFISLIFQQLLNELRPGVLFLALFIHFPGKKHPAFDIQQRGRHQQKLAHHIHIPFFHLADILHVLLRDFRNGDIVNIHFILFY